MKLVNKVNFSLVVNVALVLPAEAVKIGQIERAVLVLLPRGKRSVRLMRFSSTPVRLEFSSERGSIDAVDASLVSSL